MTDAALLFVYGTLRRGSAHPMAQRLARQSVWLGPATVIGRLYRVDWYPALVLDDVGAPVAGDLVRLADPAASLAWLDAYEGCGPGDPPPHDYARVPGSVQRADGAAVAAQCYVWNRPIEGLHPIAGSDWLAALATWRHEA